MKSSSRSTAKRPEGAPPHGLWLLGAGAAQAVQRLDLGAPGNPAAGAVRSSETATDFADEWQAVPAPAPARWCLVLLAADEADSAALAQEQALRLSLTGRGLAYQVVYPLQGSHHEALGLLLGLTQRRPRPGRLSAACEKCSDPDCEHRLFQDLLARREAQPHCT